MPGNTFISYTTLALGVLRHATSATFNTVVNSITFDGSGNARTTDSSSTNFYFNVLRYGLVTVKDALKGAFKYTLGTLASSGVFLIGGAVLGLLIVGGGSLYLSWKASKAAANAVLKSAPDASDTTANVVREEVTIPSVSKEIVPYQKPRDYSSTEESMLILENLSGYSTIFYPIEPDVDMIGITITKPLSVGNFLGRRERRKIIETLDVYLENAESFKNNRIKNV